MPSRRPALRAAATSISQAAPAIEPLAAHGQEERPAARRVRTCRPASQPGRTSSTYRRSQARATSPTGTWRSRSPLPDDAHQTIVQRHVLEVQADRLRYAQPGGVEKLEERPIADADRRLIALLAQESVDLLDAEHLGQQPRLARQVETRRQVRLDEPLREAEAVEASQRGRPPPESRGPEDVAPAAPRAIRACSGSGWGPRPMLSQVADAPRLAAKSSRSER